MFACLRGQSFPASANIKELEAPGIHIFSTGEQEGLRPFRPLKSLGGEQQGVWSGGVLASVGIILQEPGTAPLHNPSSPIPNAEPWGGSFPASANI